MRFTIILLVMAVVTAWLGIRGPTNQADERHPARVLDVIRLPAGAAKTTFMFENCASRPLRYFRHRDGEPPYGTTISLRDIGGEPRRLHLDSSGVNPRLAVVEELKPGEAIKFTLNLDQLSGRLPAGQYVLHIQIETAETEMKLSPLFLSHDVLIDVVEDGKAAMEGRIKRD